MHKKSFQIAVINETTKNKRTKAVVNILFERRFDLLLKSHFQSYQTEIKI